MTEIIVLVGALITNFVTSIIKPKNKEELTYAEQESRKVFLRVFSAVISIISVIGTAWIMGDPVDVGSLNEAIMTVLTIIATWVTSQGTYFVSQMIIKGK